MSNLISPPLDILQYKNDNELFDAAYTIFQLNLNDRKTRPNLFGRFIYIDGDYCEDGRIYGFWHTASMGEDHLKFDMDPCYNDTSREKCTYQCNMDHELNFLRDRNSIPCIYRANKIKWIREIIDLANENKNHDNLRIWVQHNQKKNEKNLMIRYIEGTIDYILIFKVCYKNSNIDMYRLITAFPVVLKSFKKRYNKEYEVYCKKKRRK